MIETYATGQQTHLGKVLDWPQYTPWSSGSSAAVSVCSHAYLHTDALMASIFPEIMAEKLHCSGQVVPWWMDVELLEKEKSLEAGIACLGLATWPTFSDRNFPQIFTLLFEFNKQWLIIKKNIVSTESVKAHLDIK